jgi:hypothetical protein
MQVIDNKNFYFDQILMMPLESVEIDVKIIESIAQISII